MPNLTGHPIMFDQKINYLLNLKLKNQESCKLKRENTCPVSSKPNYRPFVYDMIKVKCLF